MLFHIKLISKIAYSLLKIVYPLSKIRWNNNPLNSSPLENEQKYIELFKEASQIINTDVDNYENEVGFEGTVLRKGDFINANTQSVPVYVKPSNKYPLYYGMYVQADMEFEDTDLVSRIPRKAVFGKNKIYKCLLKLKK